jgi:hypothetical protein
MDQQHSVLLQVKSGLLEPSQLQNEVNAVVIKCTREKKRANQSLQAIFKG